MNDIEQFKNEIDEISEKVEELTDLIYCLQERLSHAINASRYPDHETEMLDLRRHLDDTLDNLLRIENHLLSE